MDWSDPDALAGRTIDGHRIETAVGPRCYRALRLVDRRPVLLWLLGPDAALARQLAQPLPSVPERSVLELLGGGALDGGWSYLVVEDLGAQTLDDLIDAGPVDEERAIRLLGELARALAAVHRVYGPLRDLRTADVRWVQSWGRDEVRLPPHPALLGPAAGRQLGGYCAPEASEGRVDARADQYSLGVIGHELCTGTTPHNPDAPPAERTILPLADLDDSPRLSPILRRLLEHDPEDRFPSLDAVLEALDRLDASEDERSYGQFTPVIATRVERPRRLSPEPGDGADGPEDAVTVRGLLAVGLVACAAALGLSYLLLGFT